MNKIKRATSILLVIITLFTCFSVTSFAEGQITVKFRVEGMRENYISKTVKVDEGSTALEVLREIDKKTTEINVTTQTFANGTYITKINNEEYGQLHGTDGWFYTVNYVDPDVTIEKYVVKDGDDIVVYYGDPITYGFDYPKMDLSKFTSGMIKFISYSKTFDATGNPTYEIKPIANAVITWKCAGITTKFITDGRGELYIPNEYRTNTYYVVQIEKSMSNGLPLVLRFEPNYVLNADGYQPPTEMENLFSKIVAIIVKAFHAIISLFEGSISLDDILNGKV